MDDRTLDRTNGQTSDGADDGTVHGTARATPGPTDGALLDQGLAAVPEGYATAHGAEQNRLLRALPLAEYARLLPQLTPVVLGLKQVLIEPDAPIRDVYFPRSGVGSMIADEQEGGAVEVGTIGPEGFIGLPVLMGADRMPYRVFVQVAGDGWRLSADAFRRLVDERPPCATCCCASRRPSATRSRSRSRATACTRSTSGARAGCS
jgi:hypothetical protein